MGEIKITGFADAEGSFIISIYKDINSKLKWRVSPSFSIHLHIKDISLLEEIRKTLGVGNVRKNSKNTALLRVDNIKELNIIINHFYKYPLVSSKASDFILFEQCYNLIKKKKHLTQTGFYKILELKYNLNKGITEELKKYFKNLVSKPKPKYKFNCIPNPFLISGFVSGYSTFSISIEKSNNKIGLLRRVRLIFGTCLHIRDKELLIGICNYFNMLKLKISTNTNNKLSLKEKNKYIYETKTTCMLQIKKYSDIEEIIIPFFDKYPILGVKSLDFSDFKKVSLIIKNKEHITFEGLNKIIKIVNGMNLNRKLND